MPTYEYVCKSCGEHLEVVQSFKDAALTDCPGCSGTLRKVFQPIGIAFKGSGFYKTDSRTGSSSSSSSKAGGDKPSETSTASSSEAKTETSTTPSTDKSSSPAAS
ncbi:MAG: FmdB family transcriptional regulator [Actinobacteria bacterium]|nr:FmdB family transcriptional regulator [Actinomycetota bacterium]